MEEHVAEEDEVRGITIWNLVAQFATGFKSTPRLEYKMGDQAGEAAKSKLDKTSSHSERSTSRLQIDWNH